MDSLDGLPALADALPWRQFIRIREGVVDLRDDGVLEGYWLTGPSPDSNDGDALFACTEQLGRAPVHLRTGDAIQITFDHEPAPAPPALNYARPAAAMVMAEMRDRFAAEEHWISPARLYLSHQFEKPIKNMVQEFLLASSTPQRLGSHDLLREHALGRFRAFEDAVKGPISLTPMTNEAMFRSLLHAVTYHDYPALLPDPDVRLNKVIGCEWQINGETPMINGWHLRPIVITAYPVETLPQALAILLEQPGHITISIRYRCLSPYDAQKKLEAEKPFWRQTVVGDFMEILKGFFGSKKDAGQDAFNQIAEVNDAIAASQAGTPFGTLSCVAIVRARDPVQAEFRAHNYIGQLQGKGIMARLETIGAAKAIATTWPGYLVTKRDEYEANRQRIPVTGYNFFDLALPATYWQGTPHITNHMLPANTPSPLVLSGTAGEPFYFPTHDAEGVGHLLATGRSGLGKSTTAGLFICGVQSIPDSRVTLMDNGHSSFVLGQLLGAQYHDVGADDSTPLCPMALLDQPKGLQWLMGWFERLFYRRDRFELDERGSRQFMGALRDVRMRKNDGVTSPKCRHLYDLYNAVPTGEHQCDKVRRILDEMIHSYGHIFGGEPAEQEDNPITIYELSALGTCPKYISTPAKELLLYKTMSSLNGKPAWVIWDEFWEAVGDDTSSAWFFEAIRTMRRFNCGFVGLTQNSVEITQSPHCTLLLSNMPGKLFFPDPQATTPYIAESLYKLGLNPHEVSRIAAAHRGEFFYKGAAGARMASCWLGPIGQAICASTSHQQFEAMRKMIDQFGTENLLDRWLAKHGIATESSVYSLTHAKAKTQTMCTTDAIAAAAG